MKKLAAFILLFLVAFILSGASGGTAFAASNADEVEEELENEIKENIDGVVSSEMEEYFSSVGGSTISSSLKNFLKSVINGEQPLSISTLFETIWGAVKSSLVSVISALATIVLLSILYNLSGQITSGFKKDSTKQVIYFAIYASIIAIIAALLNSVILSALNLVGAVTTLVELFFPVLLTVTVALGGVSGAAVIESATFILSGTVVKIISAVVMPLFYAAVVFTLIGNLTDNIKFTKLTKAVRSAANWILGLMFGLITTVMTFQGIVGAGVDNVAIKSAKFALSSYVPILGGYLSEGFDIVLAGAVLVKNSLGLAALAILLLIVIIPLVKIVLFSLALKLAAGIIEPMSDGKISSFLYDTASNLNILIEIVLGLFFLIFVMLLLFIASFNAGVT